MNPAVCLCGVVAWQRLLLSYTPGTGNTWMVHKGGWHMGAL